MQTRRVLRSAFLLLAAGALAACNGFDGFPRTSFQTLPGGEGERFAGDGDVTQPRFANGGAAFLAYVAMGLDGRATVFRLRAPTLESEAASVADPGTDGFGQPLPAPAPDDDSGPGSVSANGNVVCFLSRATNLLPDGRRTVEDRTHAYVRDLVTRETELVSRNADGTEANADTTGAVLSADGRFVAFATRATNLFPLARNGRSQVYVFDRLTGRLELVTHAFDDGDVPGNGDSTEPTISLDGRVVGFVSGASNLAEGDTNAMADLFVYNRTKSALTRIEGDQVGEPALSGDGMFLAFTAVEGGSRQVFVRDLATGIMPKLASSDDSAVAGAGDSRRPSLSEDGRFVAFESDAANLVPGDTNGATDVFVRDLLAGVMPVRVSVGPGGVQADGESRFATVSADGGLVAFTSRATNLVEEDEDDAEFIDGAFDLYLFPNPAR